MKIFLCEYIHPDARAMLAARAELIDDWARIGEADGILNRNLNIDAALLERCPSRKVIGIHGTGTDGVDLAAARAKGVAVVNTPGQNAGAVAELIVLLALEGSRKAYLADRAIQAGTPYPTGAQALRGTELGGKTLGLVGCGDIALRAAGILRRGFGMRVIGWSRSLTPEKAAALDIERCGSIREVFAGADVVNIGLALNEDTRGIIGAAELAAAKPGCLLINTARGALVDEAALYAALKNGPLGAAACDVLAQEPPTRSDPLTELPNFFATPHIGANTEEALRRVGCMTAQQMLDVLDGKTPENLCI